jgi:hypothetical protein
MRGDEIAMTADDSTQQERATGACVLIIDALASNESAWQALGKPLRFSRADETWLRESVPGVVRKGVRLDLTPMRDRVLATGQCARGVERSEP